MRFLASLSIVPLLWLLLAAPAAQAADVMDMGVCNFSAMGIQGTVPEATEGAALQEDILEMQGYFEFTYAALYENGTCGELNPSTGMLEKSDCKGKVLTEITEVVTDAKPNVPGETGDKIITVYQGLCCLSPSADGSTCYETRNYYTETFDQCRDMASGSGSTTNSPNCLLRQWLIAETGMGLLKLYVKQIFTFGSFAVGAIAVATIILNGVRISVAGVSGDISEAKQKITQALSGIVLLFLSALILYTINPDFFGG